MPAQEATGDFTMDITYRNADYVTFVAYCSPGKHNYGDPGLEVEIECVSYERPETPGTYTFDNVAVRDWIRGLGSNDMAYRSDEITLNYPKQDGFDAGEPGTHSHLPGLHRESVFVDFTMSQIIYGNKAGFPSDLNRLVIPFQATRPIATSAGFLIQATSPRAAMWCAGFVGTTCSNTHTVGSNPRRHSGKLTCSTNPH